MDSRMHNRYNRISMGLTDLRPLQREMMRAVQVVSDNYKEHADVMRSYIDAVDRMLAPIYEDLGRIRERIEEIAKAEQAIEDATTAFELIDGFISV